MSLYFLQNIKFWHNENYEMFFYIQIGIVMVEFILSILLGRMGLKIFSNVIYIRILTYFLP